MIRQMKEKDLKEIIAIEKLSFADPWSIDSFYRELRDNPYALYLIVRVDNRLAAYIGGWLITDELHITNLAVHPDYRRQGLAEKLLLEILNLSRQQGIARATLEVRVTNCSAIKLYQKQGFVSVGRRPKYYINNNEDALIMWKELTDD